MELTETPCNASWSGVTRRLAFAAAAGFATAAIGIIGGCRSEPVEKRPDSEQRYEAARRLMGVSWTITAYAESKERAEAAVGAAFDEVARLERILSDYDPESELSRLSARSPVTATVGDDLWKVLERANWFRDASGGAFDPTVGPLTTLWRQARRAGRLPDPDKLAAARLAVGPSTLQCDATGRSVELRRPGMRLDLGGIGMGHAVDAAMDVLDRHGIRSAMIDASGDIAVSSPPPGKTGWRIAVEPLQGGMGDGGAIEIVDAAITTSGDAYQAVEIDGVRYSHIVDPRTGVGVVGPSAVSVIAADCTTSDAAATAASVLGPEAGGRFIEGLPGAAARFQWVERGEIRTRLTSRWPGQSPRNARSP
jgi:thiamine biosynthesis lipoprotein